ncbi:MAG: Rap1a/Tai family immunity protein [Pseudomonadota bacterium]
MNLTLTAGIAAGALLALSAFETKAQSRATEARQLLLLCQGRAEQPDIDLAQCSAYLRGFLDRVLQEQVAGRKPEFCPPRARVSAQTAATALTRLAFREPAALDEPAPVFLTLALQRAFPCEFPNFPNPPVDEIQPVNPVSVSPQPLMAPQPAMPQSAMRQQSGTMQQTAAIPPITAELEGQTPANVQPDLLQPLAGTLPRGRPEVGAPGTVGPVTGAPGSTLQQGNTAMTADGMRVALPPRTGAVQAVPLTAPMESVSRPTLNTTGQLNQTPAAIADRQPERLFGRVGEREESLR